MLPAEYNSLIHWMFVVTAGRLLLLYIPVLPINGYIAHMAATALGYIHCGIPENLILYYVFWSVSLNNKLSTSVFITKKLC